MKDAASTTETRTVTVPTVDDGPTLLYTLDFECPFPWPQAPSYPTSSHAAIVTAAGDSKSGNANGVNHYMQHTHMDDTDAPTASTSKTRAEAISVQEGDRMLEESSSIHDAKDAGDALAGVQEIHYPDTLQEYYWDCLYCSTRRLKNEPASRFIKALKSEHYKTTTLHPDGTQEIHPSYRDTLSSILYTELGKLDKKYHVDLPMIIDDWTRSLEYLENGTLAEEDGVNTATITNQAGMLQDTIPRVEVIDSVKAEYTDQELSILRKSWEEWVRLARDDEGEKVPSVTERRKRLRSAIRERLSALETAELQMQILVALELLCVLPIPSYLTGRSAHHRRLHSTSTSHPQNWLAILRAGTPQRGSNGSRKRKKESSIGNDFSALPMAGPITSSNLTTPRQSTSFDYPNTLSHNHQFQIETIAEDEQDEIIIIQKQALEKLFKETARLLDSQTDNLAIQQTVSNAISGLNLNDLIMGDLSNTQFINGQEKRKEKEEELDAFQSFWLDIVEEHYSSRLPSDILSGCQSKFFSNSLDPSLAGHSLHSSNSISASQPSPFHHPTPNLKQLARSVHLANLQAEKNAIPQSPTLVKLLAAKEEISTTRKSTVTDEDDDDELRNLINGNEDVDWLMPAPAPVSLASGAKKSNFQNDKISIKRALKRTGSNNTFNSNNNNNAASGFTNMKSIIGISNHSNNNNNNNSLKHHQNRIVEFGKVKQIKEQREEIQKKMSLSLMRQSSSSSFSTSFKPFNSSSSLVNAHLQSQQANNAAVATMASLSDNNGRGSLMGKSLGVRGMKSNGNTAITNGGTALPPSNVGDENANRGYHISTSTNTAAATTTSSSLSSTTLFNPNLNDNVGRISKRKLASPKKTTLPIKNGDSTTGRTLVLATPVKLRTRPSKTLSNSALYHRDDIKGDFRNKHKQSQDQQQTFMRGGSFSNRTSSSLPAFKWGLPEFGKGIDEVDEEDMDRGFGLSENSDEEDDNCSGGEHQEQQEGIVKSSKGMVLVGETPQKG